jgi:UDP-N-acetylmuramate--alanine ligase
VRGIMDNKSLIGDLLQRRAGRIHLIGICGIGMAGIACILKQQGFDVTGCDLLRPRVATWLEAHGVDVLAEHSSSHITSELDLVIRTPAVHDDCEELVAAAEMGLNIVCRGEVLAALLVGRRSIAVAGTHGKTTTSGFIAQVLQSCGLAPTFVVGGEIETLAGVASVGEGELLVVEADESDGTAAQYEPTTAVLTSVEHDHMEHFGTVADFTRCFESFAGNAVERLVFCVDDPGASDVISHLDAGVRDVIGYGLSDQAQIRGSNVVETAESISFDVHRAGDLLGSVTLPVPGQHNVLNALATVAVAMGEGLSFEDVRDALGAVALAKRRFERVVNRDDLVVISDYAHHPSEIAAMLRTARTLGRPILALFQPHRYTRTLALKQDFPPAFADVDELVLTPVYPASESPLVGGTTWDLYEEFRKQEFAHPVSVAASLDEAWLAIRRNLRDGALLAVIGAGDVDWIADQAIDEYMDGIPVKSASLSSCPDELRAIMSDHESLAAKTTMKVGGRAEAWAEIGTLAQLKSLLGWTHAQGVPFKLIGGGSNLLISDMGLGGVVARLAGEPFRQIRREGDLVVVGAGLSVREALNWVESNGLSGLEFLDGIPATLGGVIAMNAGGCGSEIGDHIEWVRYFDESGTEAVLERPRFTYRTGLKCAAIIEAGIRVSGDSEAEIRQRRAAAAGRRAWMRGLRCAGSVFKNPDGDSAGRLIEGAGLKGERIGQAMISSEHANVIVTEKGARASDVLALIERATSAVRSEFALELQTELAILR